MPILEQVTVVSTIWFSDMSSMRPIGIVLVEYKDTKERRAFIGSCEGLDQDADTASIIECGAKLYQSQVQNLNNELLVNRGIGK